LKTIPWLTQYIFLFFLFFVFVLFVCFCVCLFVFVYYLLMFKKHISKGGNHILSGDARGFLKVWDTRVALSASTSVANGSKAPARSVAEPEDERCEEGEREKKGREE
jgi:hypothetical protein